MPDHQPNHGRRPHYRGRRGNERRGTERRTPQHAAESAPRDNVDVEQIMRDIRARIASRHGIELSTGQIQELAARRLDAILDPRHVKPSLLEQMRRAAGESVEVPEPPADTSTPFAESTLYESHQALVRFFRRLFNPLLKLFFNPAPIARAITAQNERLDAMARREADLLSRQTEWNALQYEILQRLVTEIARNSLEVQSLSLRVESLEAKLDFNERRVRAMEQGTGSARPAVRPAAEVSAEPASLQPPARAAVNGVDATSGDATRRRRRRRRGRRSGAGAAEGGAAVDGIAGDQGGVETEPDLTDDEPQNGELEAGSDTALEPAHHLSLLQPVERYPSEVPASAEPHPGAADPRELPPDVPHSPDVAAAAPPASAPAPAAAPPSHEDTAAPSSEERPAPPPSDSDIVSR